MEECEICGTRANDIYIVDVEEVELRVCAKCAKGKKIISRVSEQKAAAQARNVRAAKNEPPQLVENYGRIIQNAREAMKLPLKVLAEMINEKETLLLRVERQRTMPSQELSKKLERALKIRLTESAEAGTERVSVGRADRASLGEFMDRK